MSTLVVEQYIAVTPDVLDGKPHIINTNIAVHHLVTQYTEKGKSIQEISQNYNLPLAIVHATLSYYYDNKKWIDKIISEENQHSTNGLTATRLIGVPGRQLLQFAGLISQSDLAIMSDAIEQDCERVDIDEW